MKYRYPIFPLFISKNHTLAFEKYSSYYQKNYQLCILKLLFLEFKRIFSHKNTDLQSLDF